MFLFLADAARGIQVPERALSLQYFRNYTEHVIQLSRTRHYISIQPGRTPQPTLLIPLLILILNTSIL